MLTLDETTLFYYFRRNQSIESSKKAAGVIKNWRKAIEVDPAARLDSLKTGGTGPSSIRSASTTLQNSTRHTTTSDKPVTAARALDNEEAEEPEQRDNDACGGLADEREVDGPEGDFARSSPFKGKKRVTNDVSSSLYCTIFTDHYNGGRALSKSNMSQDDAKDQNPMKPERPKGTGMKTSRRVVWIRAVFGRGSFRQCSGMRLSLQIRGISPAKVPKRPFSAYGTLCIRAQLAA